MNENPLGRRVFCLCGGVVADVIRRRATLGAMADRFSVEQYAFRRDKKTAAGILRPLPPLCDAQWRDRPPCQKAKSTAAASLIIFRQSLKAATSYFTKFANLPCLLSFGSLAKSFEFRN